MKNAPRARCSFSSIVNRVSAPLSRTTTTSIGEPQIAQGALELAHAVRIADEARRLGKENDLGNALGADMRRQYDLVGAGMQQLALGRDRIAHRPGQ